MISHNEIEKAFRRDYRALGMYALRILEDTAEAEAVVRGVYSAMLARRGELESSDLRLYAYRAVRAAALQRLMDTHRLVAAADLPDLTHDDILASERDARVWESMDALPAECREVFLLSRRDGLNQADIAGEMNIPVRRVERCLAKAAARLAAAVRPGMPSVPGGFTSE